MRGQDEGTKTDKGMYSSAVEAGKMAPMEMGPGSLGTRGEWKCGQWDWWGWSWRYGQGTVQPMAHCLLYKLYAKSTVISMGSKKL